MCTIILNIEKVEKFPKFLSGFLIVKLALLRLYCFLIKCPLYSKFVIVHQAAARGSGLSEKTNRGSNRGDI